MNYRLSNFLMFTVGAAIGSAVTWKLLKTKYEQIAQEEIDSVKEAFSKREQEQAEKKEEPVAEAKPPKQKTKKAKKEADVKKCKEVIKKQNYKEDVDDLKLAEPYVIPPEEFGELDYYETISLTYYADGVLADDNDNVIEDVEMAVGEFESHFGEYEDDSVFVRNDQMNCDFEILKDYRTYSEAVDR